MFVVESGVLDDRATLAFVGGQCHGLALALRARTGFPLVAVFDDDGTCVHVCVRDGGGRLIDITGAHDEEDVVGDGIHSLRDVEVAFVAVLTAENGWAPADVSAAQAWVEPVLDRVARGEQLPALRHSTMRRTGAVDSELELRVEWRGGPYLDAHVRRRRKGDRKWTLYAHVAFPPTTRRACTASTSRPSGSMC